MVKSRRDEMMKVFRKNKRWKQWFLLSSNEVITLEVAPEVGVDVSVVERIEEDEGAESSEGRGLGHQCHGQSGQKDGCAHRFLSMSLLEVDMLLLLGCYLLMDVLSSPWLSP